MAWIVLIISGILEAVWATALSKTSGLSKPVPLVVFIVALTASMLGLAYALKSLPVGTAYAIWVGIGAVGTTSYAMISGAEAFTVVKLLLLLGIVGCVVGLKLTH
jgi:quaternary ammonium compound-resistance protein SugE